MKDHTLKIKEQALTVDSKIIECGQYKVHVDPWGYSYKMEDMDGRQRLSNPYPLQTKISAKFWTLHRQMAENFR